MGGKSISGLQLKTVGYGRFDKNLPCMVFPAVQYQLRKTVPLLSPLLSSSLLMSSSPPRMGLLDLRSPRRRRARAPSPSAASRLSAASSNTHVPPLIRPYPCRKKLFHMEPPPPPYRESICEYAIAKKHQTGKREIVVMGYGDYDFQNPPCIAFRQLLITLIAAADTSFRPQACQTRHYYMVTNAHRV
jgi:hypothetical protein